MSTSTNPPSSRGAAGVPPAGGNAKYIAIGVLLLFGMVALVWWKFGGGTETPKTIVTPPTQATVPESKMDDIPPPPPIEAPPPDSGAPRPTVKAYADPCPTKTCAGIMTDELESALGVRAKQAKRCYEQELKNDPTLKGKMAMTVRIGTNGSVCSANVTNSDLPAITACVERAFRASGGFPAPKNGCVERNIPMTFIPGR